MLNTKLIYSKRTHDRKRYYSIVRFTLNNTFVTLTVQQPKIQKVLYKKTAGIMAKKRYIRTKFYANFCTGRQLGYDTVGQKIHETYLVYTGRRSKRNAIYKGFKRIRYLKNMGFIYKMTLPHNGTKLRKKKSR